MTAIIYYVLPMLLGRTYDMRTNSPGVDIFPQKAIEEAEVIERHFTDAQYKMVSDTREARDFLGVSGDLSLKLKAGTVNIEGLGNYMKDTYSRSNLVEILVKVHYETETLTLPSRAEPREGWRTLDKQDIGTHYVRSITYGGDLVASLRFTAKNAADRESIRAIVQANLQADSGSFGLGIEGNFSRLQEDLKDSSSLEINYYATVPIRSVPNTMESLMELVEDFPAQTQLVNGGKGVPLSMELFPLSALDSDMPRYLETTALVDQLDRLESQFDDIRATKKVLQEWLLNVPPVLTQELEDGVGAFNADLERISFVFYQTLGGLDLDEKADVAQFQAAFDAYAGPEGGSLPDKYYRKFQLLRHKIIQSSKVLQTDVGGATYVHWGSDECGNSQTLYTGILASTDRTKGGTASIVCLTDDPQTDDSAKDYKRHHKFYSKLSPVLLSGRNVSASSPISCSACLSVERTAAHTFPGRASCPSAAWTQEYAGFLAAKGFESRRGDFLCVDADAREAAASPLLNAQADVGDALADLGTLCGTLPCDAAYGDAGALIPCVVCSY